MSPNRLLGLLPLVIVALIAAACAPRDATRSVEPRDGVYTSRPASPDGIGKVYMGREIAFTLGHTGIPWLERADREETERPDFLMDGLDLAADAVVADIGAGSGYMTFRLAPRVPSGKVLAVDIQREMLEAIERRVEAGEASNVETVLGEIDDPNLPDGEVDAVLIVDAYHEFSHPREMMQAIVRDLAPGGEVYLVEYREEDPDVDILPLHKMSEAQARRELEAVGLELVENRDVLPQQHLMVFRRSEAR